MQAFGIIVVFIILLKLFLYIFKYLDYLFIMLLAMVIFEAVAGVKFFDENIHTVFKILIAVVPCGIWFVLNKFVCIGEFYPFKWIGALFNGLACGWLVFDNGGLDIIWAVAIGVVAGVISIISRHVNISEIG